MFISLILAEICKTLELANWTIVLCYITFGCSIITMVGRVIRRIIETKEKRLKKSLPTIVTLSRNVPMKWKVIK